MTPLKALPALLLLVSVAAQAQMAAPVALDKTETEEFFKLAKMGLLNKKVISDGKPYLVRCVILDFLKSSYSKSYDDSAYEQLVDNTIANTELFYADPACREKLNHPEPNVVAIAVPAKSHTAVEKSCGHKYGDAKKDSILIFSKQQAKGVPLTAHETAHIMLANLDGAKPKWDVHHGMTNFLGWNKGSPTKAWSPAGDSCKKSSGNQSAGLLNFSGGSYDRPEYQVDETEHADEPPAPENE